MYQPVLYGHEIVVLLVSTGDAGQSALFEIEFHSLICSESTHPAPTQNLRWLFIALDIYVRVFDPLDTLKSAFSL